MIIYFSGVTNTDSIVFKELNVNSILFSYFYMKKYEKDKRTIEEITGFSNVFLDSGAWSAYASGKTIEIQKLIDFIKNHGVKIYCNLDDIGSWEQTMKNQKIMESQGLNPLPVFHYGEPWHVLDYYCNSYDYVGIGGLAGIRDTSERRRFLNIIFSKYPKHKFHGFAITSEKLMKEYPFFSVDSTTWNVLRKFGELTTKMGRIYIGKDIEHDSHLQNVSSEELEDIKVMLTEMGIDFEKIKTNDSKETIKLCIKHFIELEKSININPFVFKKKQTQLDMFLSKASSVNYSQIIAEHEKSKRYCKICNNDDFELLVNGQLYCKKCGDIYE